MGIDTASVSGKLIVVEEQRRTGLASTLEMRPPYWLVKLAAAVGMVAPSSQLSAAEIPLPTPPDASAQTEVATPARLDVSTPPSADVAASAREAVSIEPASSSVRPRSSRPSTPADSDWAKGARQDSQGGRCRADLEERVQRENAP